jgi:hypothetical protein
MKVEVYRNLHKNCWSVRIPHGKVWYHCQALFIFNARFVVQKAGNAKVRQTGKKNVHAFVRGELGTMWEEMRICRYLNGDKRQVKYNPYKNKTFVYADTGELAEMSQKVFLDANGYVFEDE